MEKIKKAISLMLVLSHRHKNYLESRLAANGLDIYPAQHRILVNIDLMPGIGQKELAKVLQVSPATITISVKKLIKAGYITKNNSDADNRRNVLAITEKGKEIVDKSAAIFDSIDNEIFEGFSDEEMDTMIHYFERVLANIDRVYPQGKSCECMVCNNEDFDIKEQEEE